MHASWSRASRYDTYMGRWSAAVADAFIPWLEPSSGGEWADLGAGTGCLTEALCRQTRPSSVRCLDRSEAFLGAAVAKLDSCPATVILGDLQALPFLNSAVDYSVSGLVLNFLIRPWEAVREMARVTRSGGRLGAYIWDYAGRMDLLRSFWDGAMTVDPGCIEVDRNLRSSLQTEQSLHDLLTEAGVQEVRTRSIDVEAKFASFEEYWEPFTWGQGLIGRYVSSLEPEQRVAIREALRSTLPTIDDGSLVFLARALAVQGVAP